MIYALVSHPVQDFAAWKPFFYSDQARVNAAGMRLVKLFRSVDNPNNVSILFSAPSQEVFDAVLHDPVLPELMKQAGVLAPPTFQLFNEA